MQDICKVGNKGAHPREHKRLTEDGAQDALKKLHNICEWVITACIKENKFRPGSWVPTVLSMLKPVYRVRILNELFCYLQIDTELVRKLNVYLKKRQRALQWPCCQEGSANYQQVDNTEDDIQCKDFLFVLDKLAMAYLKNNEYERSLDFVNDCFEKKLIDCYYKNDMNCKLQLLQKDSSKLGISKGIADTRKSFQSILADIKEKECCFFLAIFTSIIVQDNLGSPEA